MPTVSQWWEYFRKGTQHYKNDTVHWDAWCNSCLKHRTNEIVQFQRVTSQSSGSAGVVMSYEDAEACVMADKTASFYMPGKIDRMVRHLSSCPNVPDSVRQAAALERFQSKSRGKENRPPTPIIPP
ncbi:hypothetical protein GLOTRDRAFT_132821 [Gloeophyllum trabeum ATCC 11539]|uniref:Uncharacterized protein n=1 Tax=Gloeophyllum trabeum (strain ATCC 11539 / FP-39264 / Madison 617) TaxID=670483 RepID=S7PUG2_GLOTA|nr:uncharacterized protein GLOTRDRAFT_132821 [Gloeophyllum trabeum ATCC 11539]EPQ51451.1 hypothetical protein GLOTRDRAFT_132821 [Gloeophyllum trabeum ATCC 11539]